MTINATSLDLIEDLATKPPEATLEVLEREFGRIGFGKSSYLVIKTKTGELTAQRIRNRRYIYPDNAKMVSELNLIGTVGGIPLRTGVTVILAATGKGKSPILQFVAQALGAPVIRYGEPLPGYLINEEDLALALLTTQGRVIAVDSVKNLMGRIEGNAMKSGLSREAFYFLSDMSAFYATMDKALLVVVNPATTDPAAYAEAVTALESNTNGVLSLAADGTLDWIVRTGEGKQRAVGRSKITWSDSGVRRIDPLDAPQMANNDDVVSIAVQHIVSNSATLGSAIRRATETSFNNQR